MLSWQSLPHLSRADHRIAQPLPMTANEPVAMTRTHAAAPWRKSFERLT